MKKLIDKYSMAAWVTSFVFAIILCIIFVRTDGSYRYIVKTKESIGEYFLFGNRNDIKISLEGYKPLIDENDAWYTKYHFISHAGGGIDGKLYTNSLEAWQESYIHGNRIYDADIDVSSDGVLILRHDWNDDLDTENFRNHNIRFFDRNGVARRMYQDYTPSVPDYATFVEKKIYNKYTPMSFNCVLDFMETHQDCYVSCDVKSNNDLVYKQMKEMINKRNNPRELYSRIIVNIYRFKEYEEIKSIFPAKNVVLRQYYISPHNYGDIIDFCLKNDIHVVSVSSCYMNDPGVNLMQKYGIHTMVAVCDYISEMREYVRSGTSMAVTDWLREDDWPLIYTFK